MVLVSFMRKAAAAQYDSLRWCSHPLQPKVFDGMVHHEHTLTIFQLEAVCAAHQFVVGGIITVRATVGLSGMCQLRIASPTTRNTRKRHAARDVVDV